VKARRSIRTSRIALIGLLAIANSLSMLLAAPAAHAATARSISAGFGHSCLVVSSNGAVKCWGRNDRGQLGNGTTMSSTTPVGVVGMQSKFSAVSTGVNGSCALSTAGGLKCWGASSYLGNGSGTDSSVPIQVTGLSSGVIAVSAGSDHVCALTASGGVKCWGAGSHGQLGDGLGTTSLTPVDVAGLSTGVAAVAAGSVHTCALKTDGTVWCWGYNAYGQAGEPSLLDAPSPVQVAGLSGVRSIASGGYHSCAITADATAACWGQNQYGELGDGTTVDSATPVIVVGLSSVVSITGGFYHTCAVTTAGAALCWGANNTGAIGDGTTTGRLVPAPVAGLSAGVVGIDGGRGHTCAVTVAGRALCWGWNLYGQIGNGTVSTSPTLTPVPVSGYAK
jgi:alpha-tubulin suppressor-like RCC1 family protein